MSKLHQIVDVCCLWPWLGLPLVALRYITYFRFCFYNVQNDNHRDHYFVDRESAHCDSRGMSLGAKSAFYDYFVNKNVVGYVEKSLIYCVTNIEGRSGERETGEYW